MSTDPPQHPSESERPRDAADILFDPLAGFEPPTPDIELGLDAPPEAEAKPRAASTVAEPAAASDPEALPFAEPIEDEPATPQAAVEPLPASPDTPPEPGPRVKLIATRLPELPGDEPPTDHPQPRVRVIPPGSPKIRVVRPNTPE